MEGKRETAPNFSNGTSLNDLELPLPPVSRSLHFWRWISQKRYDRHSFSGVL